MKRNAHRILVGDCERTMTLDGKALCRAEIAAFHELLGEGGGIVVACTQEAPLFAEMGAKSAPDADLRFVNIRESASKSTWISPARAGSSFGARTAYRLQ